MSTIINSIYVYIKKIDKLLPLACIALAVYGLVLIFSATYSFDNIKLLYTHLTGVIIGIILMFIIANIDYNYNSKIYILFFIASLVLIILTFYFGQEAKGNKSWLRFGGIGFQPSELIKIFFILTFSKHLDYEKENINSIKSVVLLTAHFLAYFAMIIFQGDTGVALVFLFIFLFMMFCAGLSWKYFVAGSFLAAISTPFIWSKMEYYQQLRILAVYDTNLDPSGFGYHTIQSKIALGGGQLWGQGYLNGVQTQFEILPEKHTDFIFSVCGEEFGLIGCLIIILLISLIVIRVISIGGRSKDGLGYFLTTGVAGLLIFQSLENIGMCIGLLPVIGITLPFVSYGGSSVLSTFMTIGLVLSVYQHRKTSMFGPD